MINENNELLESLVRGDRATVQKLYQVVYPKVISYVLKNRGNHEDAEDIFQKALMQIIARYKVNPFDINSTFDGYLYVVCRNLWLRELKSRTKEVTNDKVLELTSEEDDIALSALEQEKWELFQEKLSVISQKCKQLLQLFFKKVPHKDIANQLGYNSDNVVRQSVFKCKTQLTKAIQNDTRFLQLKEI